MPSGATTRRSARCGLALDVPPPAPGEIRVSLFCYPNPALPALLDAWAEGDDAIVCVVPEGVATGALDAWTAGNVPHPRHPYHRGRLTLHAIPFVAQDTYDRLLWASSLNFVRGEDSFVRAQWAARAVRLEHLSPAARGALAEARRVPRALDRRTRIGAGGGAAPLLAGLERRAGCGRSTPLGGTSRWRARRSTGMPRPGRRSWPQLPDLASGLVKAALHRV